ncbi:MAG TPA: malate synthase A, partial [Chromatiaceae bacterium]|nr:malate synthase A [Chromatiaceae bacterium]
MIKFTNELTPDYKQILTTDAIKFIGNLHILFAPAIKSLLEDRKGPPALEFQAKTEYIRTSEWHVAPIPSDLQDRRVE